MQTERRVAANPQAKPTDLGCESAERLAATIRRHHRHLLIPRIVARFTKQSESNLLRFERIAERRTIRANSRQTRQTAG